jgi:hypothetical protein
MTRQRWSPAARAYAATQRAFADPGDRDPRRRDLRVGDADRQRVVADLQRHYVEGRLTSEELSERVDKALAARTEGDLATLLADLPSERPLEPARQRPNREWWTPFVSMPGVLLVAIMALLLLTWLVWLPSAHLGGPPVWSFLFLGGFFFFGRPPRSRR